MWALVTQRRRGDQGAPQPAGALGSPSVEGRVCRAEGTGARPRIYNQRRGGSGASQDDDPLSLGSDGS